MGEHQGRIFGRDGSAACQRRENRPDPGACEIRPRRRTRFPRSIFVHGFLPRRVLRSPRSIITEPAGPARPKRTELVKAVVVLKPGVAPSDALAAELQDFVRQRLSAHEYPRELAFIAEMPLTATGKVIRRPLRRQA